jgi:hypothetical protein
MVGALHTKRDIKWERESLSCVCVCDCFLNSARFDIDVLEWSVSCTASLRW